MDTPATINFSLRNFLHVVFKRKILIMLFFGAVFMTAAIGTWWVNPTYEATSQIIVKIGRENIYVPTRGDMRPVINTKSEQQINAEIEILRSRRLAKKIINAIGPQLICSAPVSKMRSFLTGIIPENLEDFLTGIIPENLKDFISEKIKRQSKPEPAQRALRALQKNLTVERIKDSNVIEVRFQHTDPRMAAKVLNKLSDFFLDRHLEVFGTSESYKFFEQQARILKGKLMRTQAKLQALKEQHDVTEMDEQQSILLQQIAKVRLNLEESQGREVELETRIQKLRFQLNQIPKTIFQSEKTRMNESLIMSLQNHLLELQHEANRYTTEVPYKRKIQKEIEIIQEQIAREETKRYGEEYTGINVIYQGMQAKLYQNEADLKAIRAKRRAQEVQLDAYKKELKELNKIEMIHHQLGQEIEIDQENYRVYLAKFEEFRISNSLDSERIASVSLLEPADVPLNPIKPKKLMNLSLGIFLGLLGGLGLAFFLHYLDDSLDSVESVEKCLEVPVLISIPYDKKREHKISRRPTRTHT